MARLAVSSSQLHRPLLWAVLTTLAGCGPVAPQPTGRPAPRPVGVPLGTITSLAVSSAGGRVASDDGLLSLDVPAGALANATELRVQRVTNTAPGGVGAAYRLEPEGLTFATPVTLTFDATQVDQPVDALSVAYQEGQGYWLRVPQTDLSRDAGAKQVSVRTRHFSGWSLVTTDTARDLQGTFTLASDLDLPYSGITGSATFTWAGEDPGVSYYLVAGTIVLPDPLAVGADSCTPTSPETAALALRTNIAELRTSPAAFFWGLSGHWTLSCTGPSGPSSQMVLTAFDTQGISHSTCARGYDAGVPLALGPDRVEGAFAVDCGAKGGTTASWTFSSSRCGTTCTASGPCHTAAYDCATGAAVCVDTGVISDGLPGACPAPQTCQGGTCTP